jgi:hypothetical protein
VFVEELVSTAIRPSVVGSGRGLFLAESKASPGESLASSHSICQRAAAGRCEWCFGPAGSRCTGPCEGTMFCSRECQRAAWAAFHKAECRGGKLPHDPQLVMLARLARLGGEELEALESLAGLPSLGAGSLTPHLTLAARALSSVGGVEEGRSCHLAGVLQVNGTVVDDWETNATLGCGLFPGDVSLVNHSCDPNATRGFELEAGERPRAVIRAVREVQAEEEVTVSYISPLLPREERARRLKESWGFVCGCARCKAGETEEQRQALARLARAIEDCERAIAASDFPAALASSSLIISLSRSVMGPSYRSPELAVELFRNAKLAALSPQADPKQLARQATEAAEMAAICLGEDHVFTSMVKRYTAECWQQVPPDETVID